MTDLTPNPGGLCYRSPRRDPSQRLRQLVAVTMLATSSAGAWAADLPTSSLQRSGPLGFGNLPYGSSSDDAVELNRHNGRLVLNGTTYVMTYSTELLGLTFEVTQNYDSERKAIDAIATMSSTETNIVCISRFNIFLNALQANYGSPTTNPIASHDAAGASDTYTVMFEFNKQDGIEAAVTTPGDAKPGGGAAAGSAGTGDTPRGPCNIRLHYLPAGWVGKL